jgi:hypothetical protein
MLYREEAIAIGGRHLSYKEKKVSIIAYTTSGSSSHARMIDARPPRPRTPRYRSQTFGADH